MSIWDMANEKLKETKNKDYDHDGAPNKETQEDTHIIIFGSKACGKSSLILRFLEKDEQVRPTIALEYMYGRRSKGNGKEVGHIWELAGNLSNATLLNISISQQKIESLGLILMIDLSTPSEMWKTVEIYLNVLRHRIDAILSRNLQLKEKLMLKLLSKFGDNHPDKAFINHSLVPLAIIGAKYDKFQELSTEERQMICKTLRFIAHTNGASLLFFSNKIESLVSRGRALLSHLLFGTTPSKGIAADPNKPLFIPAGADSLADIGLPKIDASVPNASPTDLWKNAFSAMFPTKAFVDNLPSDPGLDPQYEDKAIDSMKTQKEKVKQNYEQICHRNIFPD